MRGEQSIRGSGTVAKPKPAERARRSITPKGREEFLAALAAGWSVQAAADRAGWQRSRFYALRDVDEAFAQEWEEAIEAGCDVLEDALRTAASDGWDEETYDGEGALIRRTRRRDPRLNERLLERRRPTERAAVNVQVAAITVEQDAAAQARLFAKLADIGLVRRDVVDVEATELRELEAGVPPEERRSPGASRDPVRTSPPPRKDAS